MNTNLIALRRKEHFESLNLEIQKELDNFYDTKAATHQLKVIKKSRSIPKVGDVFLIDTILVNGSAKLIAALSGVFRKLQTGYIYTYATAMVFGLLLLIVYWFYPVILKTLLS